MELFDPEQSEIITHIILASQSISQWLRQHPNMRREMVTEKLIDALDLLVAFYAPEIAQRGVDR
jgi:hypothetical protein